MQSIQQSSHSSSLKPKGFNVARLTELKSELRDAERRQSAEIARQTEEIARLSQDVTWSAKGFFLHKCQISRVQMAHDDGLFFTLREICCLSCQSQDLFWFDFGIHMDFGFH